ncbi:ATP-grasp fold amidoligase family protein [uncultured Clostridium sp.]|uniref:ATP-grasp fold amidoligase family protein n=1 Tax=uncultured Clostridium sp. TaxID=59620 RepID=UPI0033905117
MSNILKKFEFFLFNKEKRTTYLAQKGFYKNMSDEKFLKKQFKNVFGYELDLENPITYSEKLQWLKLFDRNPKYTKLVDKYEVKKIIAEMIGDEYIIPTIGVWDKFDEIDFTKLPQQFVLKCTHDSGGLVICKDKNEFNIKKAKKKIEKCLKNDYYMQNREWPYKNVKPRIIAEEYMVDESGYELKDYKIFCFNGEAKAMFIASDRSNPKEETKFDFYDMNFNHLPFENGHPNSKKEIKKPESLELMTKLAETLSVELPQARIDFYDINGKVYFGEITFFHWSGFKKFEPKEWDEIFGGWIKLPLS